MHCIEIIDFVILYNSWLSFVQFSEEDVDYSNAAALTQYDYPPRIIFEMMPSENAESSRLLFKLTGMEKPVLFNVSLLKTTARGAL